MQIFPNIGLKATVEGDKILLMKHHCYKIRQHFRHRFYHSLLVSIKKDDKKQPGARKDFRKGNKGQSKDQNGAPQKGRPGKRKLDGDGGEGGDDGAKSLATGPKKSKLKLNTGTSY